MTTDLYTKAILALIALCLAALVAEAFWLHQSGRFITGRMPDTCGTADYNPCYVRILNR